MPAGVVWNRPGMWAVTAGSQRMAVWSHYLLRQNVRISKIFGLRPAQGGSTVNLLGEDVLTISDL